uniref:Choline transporter-like protein n=1 Tax=Gadus morhua TaxID=8049 RepID=A0A8C5B457_GADMO
MGKKKDSDPDSKEYGEAAQFDPTFHGPIHNRSCTDIICCVLFMLVILGYMVVGIIAWLYGDPRHVLYPRNSTGSFCGIDHNKGKPNVFYFDLLQCATSTNVIAAALNGLQCPTTQPLSCSSMTRWAPGVMFWASYFDCFDGSDLNVSSKSVSVSQSVTEIVDKELCPFFYTPTTSVDGKSLLFVSIKLCFASVRDVVNSFNAKDVVTRGLLLSHALLFYYVLLYSVLLCNTLLCSTLLCIWHCYWEYDNYKTRAVSITDIGFTTNLEVYLQTQETWLAFLIIIAVAEAIILLTVIFLRKRILIAIALIQEASRAVGHMMSTLLYPLVTFVLVLVCVAYWGITALYLATSGAPIYRVVALNVSQGDCERYNGTQECDPLNFNSSSAPGCPSARCIFIRYNDEGLLQRNIFNLQIYNAVAFLWCVNFVIALGQCTLAGAFASYYWAFSKPSDIPYFPLSSAFIRTLRYHVGSLAFGALILTLVQIVRILLEYIDHKTRSAQNPCARFLMCCLKCCFWCLEKFIKFLNRNAYIMIAVYGKNFCVSAKNAFFLLMRNIIRVVVLDKVTDLLLFFGKLLVVGGVAVLSFFFFSGRIPLPGETFRSENLNYYWMPIITVAIGSYLIAHGFFSVYNMCVDTLFLCFLEDLERNDGSQERPYYMSKNLMKILNKSNKGAK